MTGHEPRLVRIVGLPVDLVERSRVHYDALRRELTLLSLSSAAAKRSVPARLLALADQPSVRFSIVTATQSRALAAARSRGVASIDLEFEVTTETAAASAELAALLDEADEFCRDGTLLTLETPPDCVAFRRWYLGEFTRQLERRPPTPWPEPRRFRPAASG
jgi:hypothetical protein